MMTLPQAIETLGSGGKWPDLTEAIGVAVSSPRSVALDLVLGLKHGGVVAEQAAFALYRMTGRPLPEDRSALITDVLRWVDVIIATGEADRSNA